MHSHGEYLYSEEGGGDGPKVKLHDSSAWSHETSSKRINTIEFIGYRLLQPMYQSAILGQLFSVRSCYGVDAAASISIRYDVN